MSRCDFGLMKLLPFVLCSALLAPGLSAQSSVWKVTRGDHVVYLGGTVHVLRATDFPLPAEFDVAYGAAEELWFEVDFAELQSAAAIGLLLRNGVLPEGETLETRVSSDAWSALADYCTQSGLSLATMGRFKPGVLMMNIQMFEVTKLGLHQQGVEMHYAQQATIDQKPTRGLETIAEQFGFVESLGEKDPSGLILQTLRDLHKTEAMIDAAIDAWRRGDLLLLDKAVLKEMEEDSPEVAETLVVRRNHNWVPQIESLLANAPVELILVGAGHLPGKDGLIALLQERGCAIEQVLAEQAAPRVREVPTPE
jgi:uncharacterized protein